jgi:predicted ATPase/signal transduction histidine kinase/CheY-like chemotaxis protein
MVLKKIAGYEIHETIYSGKRSIIYRATQISSSLPVIIKMPFSDRPSTQELQRLEHEFDLAKSLEESPYFLRYYALEKHGYSLMLIIEDVGALSLEKIIPEQGMAVSTFLIKAIDFAEGLELLHQQNILHKDINPHNLLIHFNSNRNIFIDFGLSSRLQKDQRLLANNESINGTIAYISPEQTGRTRQYMDQRSDLYSLGVTFYQMLTGHLPFIANDYLTLIQGHLAKLPTPITEITSKTPGILSEIILKLLAKNPQDRYQSAQGLKADLQYCLEQLNAKSNIAPFVLAQKDVFEKFEISTKLYNREKALAELTASFEDVYQHRMTSLLTLVLGPAGMGKTALINEVTSPLLRKNAYFIVGKYERFKEDVPYSGILQAFKQFIQQLLLGSEDSLIYWKQEFLTALGQNTQVIVNIMPELADIVGPQPAVIELSTVESQNRFHYALQNFISVCSKKQHPLVIVLDDLQWADASSLKLLEYLVTTAKNRYLLIIGTYRDNEIDSTHRLSHTLRAIEEQRILRFVTLEPLALDDIKALLADTFRQPQNEAITSLATLVHQKTKGNPFFIKTILQSFYQNNLIVYQTEHNRWFWDLSLLDKQAVTDNIIDFMIDKLQKLPSATQKALLIAAGIGRQFDLYLLALMSETTLANTANIVWEAIEQGLLVAIESQINWDKESWTTHPDVSFQFLHERIQDAAALLIPAEQLKATHLRLGRLLLNQNSPEEIEAKLFIIVARLNSGCDLIESAEEKLLLAHLNLRASKKAKKLMAFDINYTDTGISLLADNAWQDQYELAFDLYQHHIERHYLLKHTDEAEHYYAIALKHTYSTQDTIKLYLIKKVFLDLEQDFLQAIQLMQEGLKLLGIELPQSEHALQLQLQQNITEIKTQLDSQSIESISNIPEIKDSKQKVILHLLQELWSSCYIASLPKLSALISSMMVKIALRYGNDKITSTAYVYYASYLGSLTKDYNTAYAIGQLGVALADKYNNPLVKSKCYLIFASGSNTWLKPLKLSLEYLKTAYQLGIESGNFADASYACHMLILYTFNSGIALTKAHNECYDYFKFLKQYHLPMYNLTIAAMQPFRNLMQVAALHDEVKYLVDYESQLLFLAAHYYGKLLDSYFSQNWQQGINLVEQVIQKLPKEFIGSYTVTEMEFFIALIYLEAYKVASEEKKAEYWLQIIAIQNHFEHWTGSCKANFQSQWLILTAEIAQVEKKGMDEVADLYDIAIATASEYELVQYEALGNELCGKFLFNKGKEKKARGYLQDAYYLYQRWDAKLKVQQIENDYPHIITIARHILHISPQNTPNATQSTSDEVNLQQLRIQSMAKASEVAVNDGNLEKFLYKMMQIVLENAGAQRGVFITIEPEASTVEIDINISNEIPLALKPIPLAEWQAGPTSVIQSVKRFEKPLILGNASQEREFNFDSYFQDRDIKSILCMPIIRHQELKGILYLENNIMHRAFNEDQTVTLHMLISQMAIFIENAKLFETRLKVTMEMAEQETRILVAENYKQQQDYFIDMICHEIRNPIQGIYGNVDFIQSGIKTIKLLLENTSFASNEKFHKELTQQLITLQESIDAIYDCAQHQTIITNDVLDLSKLEAGKVQLNEVAFFPKTIVDSVIRMFESQASDKKLLLSPVFVGEAIAIKSDPGRFKQILINLLSNAVKFTKQGSITITVFYPEIHEESALLKLSVKDTGIGMTPEEADKLFRRFEQANQKTYSQYGGSGLGLFISKNLVELMKGSIQVTSKKGLGTEFTLMLECGLVTKAEQLTLEDSIKKLNIELPASITLTAMANVLIVEDNILNQKVLLRLLTKKGYICTVANHGAEAVELYNKLRFDIIIMDMEMPIMNGIEATRVIRKIEQTQKKALTRIIGLSGNARDVYETRALSVGMNDYLTKPVKPEELYSTLIKWLQADLSSILISKSYSNRSLSAALSLELVNDEKIHSLSANTEADKQFNTFDVDSLTANLPSVPNSSSQNFLASSKLTSYPGSIFTLKQNKINNILSLPILFQEKQEKDLKTQIDNKIKEVINLLEQYQTLSNVDYDYIQVIKKDLGIIGQHAQPLLCLDSHIAILNSSIDSQPVPKL